MTTKTTVNTQQVLSGMTVGEAIERAEIRLLTAIRFIEGSDTRTHVPCEGLETARLTLRDSPDLSDVMNAYDAVRYWLITAQPDPADAGHRLAVGEAAHALGTLTEIERTLLGLGN